jgi:hypothetical protein
MQQTEKQEHERACEKPSRATGQPAHAPILSRIVRQSKRGDILVVG